MDAQANYRLKREITDALEECLLRISEEEREAFAEYFCTILPEYLRQTHLTWRYNRLPPPKPPR